VECRHRLDQLNRVARIVVEPPAGTHGLSIGSRIGKIFVAPQPNVSDLFRGRRVLFTMSKNNELVWIKDWVQFHVTHHGCDGVLLYDNGSDRYSLSELSSELSDSFPQLASLVIGWPFPYGVFDGRSFPGYRLWDSNYCQLIMLEHARQRVLCSANSVLNLDVDELVLTSSGRSIFEIAEASLTGQVVFHGMWVENRRKIGDRSRGSVPRHMDFYFISAAEGENTESKWAAVPARCPPDAQWYVHSIAGMAASPDLGEASLRHFKGINTNWTLDGVSAETARTDLVPAHGPNLMLDRDLRLAMLTADRAMPRRQKTASAPTAEHWINVRARLVQNAVREGRREEALSLLGASPDKLKSHPGMLELLADIVAESDPDESEALKRKSDTIRESDPWFNFQRARWLSAAQGDLDAALQHLDKAIDLDGNLFPAYQAAFAILSQRGAHPEAVAYLEQYRAAHPDEPAAELVLARALIARNQFSKPLEHLRAALARAPTFAAAYHALGNCLAALGQLDEAQSAIEQGIKCLEAIDRFSLQIPPLSTSSCTPPTIRPARFHIELSDILLRKNERSAAEASLRKALSLDANATDIWLRLANVNERSGQKREAAKARETALAVASARLKYATVHLCGGRRLQQRQLDEAHAKLAATLMSCGQAAGAMRILNERLERSPGSVPLIKQLAKYYEDEGRSFDAEALLVRALELQPCNGDLHAVISSVLLRRDADRAIAAAEAALRIEPRNVAYGLNLAGALNAAGRQYEAVSVLRAMSQYEPKHAHLRFRLSRLLTDLKQLSEALMEAEAAVAMSPYAERHLQHLIRLYLQDNRLEDASTVLGRALKIWPESISLHHQLSRLKDRRPRPKGSSLDAVG
jgi:tetratricopeptide (TPR) repeat protein